MTNRTVAAARGGVVALVAGLVTVVAGLGLGVVPAAAHTSLISSTPEDGATLDDSPAEVVLEFNDDLLAEFTQVAVLDEEDGNHEQGDPEIDGRRVTQAVAPLEPGEYRVSYRVGSGDGHPVSGVITFTVAEAQAATEQDAAGAGNDESAAVSDEVAAEGNETPLWIGGGAAAAVAAVVVVLLATRWRGDGSEPTQNPDR